MKSFQINDLNNFIEKLFHSEIFDNLETVELSLTTDITYQIDGRLTSPKDPQKTDDGDYIRYSDVRPTIFYIFERHPEIKKLKLVLFHRSADRSVISGGFINISIQNDTIMLTSAVSYVTFTPDKTYEDAWDNYLSKLLTGNGIE